MNRLLLLIPTSAYQTHDFMLASEALGVEITVGSDRRQALAAQVPGKTLALNFLDPDAIVRDIRAFSRNYPLQAILGVDDDTALLAAIANEALGIFHNSVTSVRSSRFKHLMRRKLLYAGLPSPRFRVFPIGTNRYKATESVQFPCVLKPLFLGASRGVIRADNPEEFVAAFDRIVAILSRKEVAKRGREAAREILVEDYISGEEVALEGLLVDGKLQILSLFDKPDPLQGPYFEETIYVTPSRLEDRIQSKIFNTTVAAVEALGLREGPVHAELRYNDSGVWIVEVAARAIGGLCSRTLHFRSGVSLEELILRNALGLNVYGMLDRDDLATGVFMMAVPHNGRLLCVEGLNSARQVAGVEDIIVTIPLGQEVETLPEGSKYLGFIFARGITPEKVEGTLREAFQEIKVKIGKTINRP